MTIPARADYLCPKCGLELAHLDIAMNGSVRGLFGFLLAPGSVLAERYRVVRLLGKGGFGATYSAEDLKLSAKRRALKEIPELLFDQNEAGLLGRLSHPAIPDIVDRFSEREMVYLVLEFGGSRTLDSECRRLGGKMPIPEIISYMHQLCGALSYLHAQDPPIIHRDLKPENILIDDNDRIMLVDFGIARESVPESTTRISARAISRGFSPPEQILGTGTDVRADIYAFGATLYYLLTGRVPPAANERVAGRDVEAPSSLVPGLSPDIDEALMSTLSLNVNQRPGSIEDLERVVDGLRALAGARTPQSSRTVRLDTGTDGPLPAHAKTPVPGRGTRGSREAAIESARSVRGSRSRILLAILVFLFFTFCITGSIHFEPAAPTTPSIRPPSPIKGKRRLPWKAWIDRVYGPGRSSTSNSGR